MSATCVSNRQLGHLEENGEVTRYLSRNEAMATVRRGQSVAQFLAYIVETDGGTGSFRYVWAAGTPRDGVSVGVEHVLDIGDGEVADTTCFPDVEAWEPEFTPEGRLIGGPDPRYRSFFTVEEAFAWLEGEHGAADRKWRHASMLDDEYIAARAAARGK